MYKLTSLVVALLLARKFRGATGLLFKPVHKEFNPGVQAMRCGLCVSVVLCGQSTAVLKAYLLPRFAMVLMEVGISDAMKDQGTLL